MSPQLTKSNSNLMLGGSFAASCILFEKIIYGSMARANKLQYFFLGILFNVARSVCTLSYYLVSLSFHNSMILRTKQDFLSDDMWAEI